MEHKSHYREDEVLTPAMRERIEAFYARIDGRLAREWWRECCARRDARKGVRHA